MRKSALIVEVNKKKVNTLDEFNQMLEEPPEDRPVLYSLNKMATLNSYH